MSDRNAPKIKTLQSWKSEFNWLMFDVNIGLQCNVCKKWTEKIISVKNFSDTFIKGSTNYRKSTTADHAKTAQHLKSLELEEKETCVSEGRKYQKHVTLTAPADSPICRGINKMSESERTGMKMLFEAAYLNGKKGKPYSDFEDWIELAKFQGIKLTVPYQNRTQCTEFIKYISEALFDENIGKKLERVNFIAVFCDGSTDVAVIEKECIYILFADPDNFQPKLTFLSLKDLPSQDANGIMSAIIEAFNDVQMPFLKDKLVYLASDGATVNSGTKAGLAVKFKEVGASWLVFVWCMSHRIELALKDSLDDAMQPIKKSLTALFYCYEKSSKKLREFRKLHKVLSELYEFEDGRVKPSKCSGTRWIAHVLRSMSGLIDKFGLYLQHFETIISDTTKKTDKATLEGKRKQLTDASILLRSALFIDLLRPAKKFNILSQREDFNIIDMVDCLDDMLLSYQIRKRNIDNDPDIVYSFPTVEKLLKNIKITTSENVTLAYLYQDVKIDYFQREKTNLSKNAASFIDQILDSKVLQVRRQMLRVGQPPAMQFFVMFALFWIHGNGF